MSAEVTISTSVPEALSRNVDQIAAAMRRNRSWVIKQALRSYVARERQFLEAAEEGIEAYKRGDVVNHAEVVAAFEQRRRKQ